MSIVIHAFPNSSMPLSSSSEPVGLSPLAQEMITDPYDGQLYPYQEKDPVIIKDLEGLAAKLKDLLQTHGNAASVVNRDMLKALSFAPRKKEEPPRASGSLPYDSYFDRATIKLAKVPSFPQAREMMGDNYFGLEEVQSVFPTSISLPPDKVPSIPFTKETLEIAAMNGGQLILRVQSPNITLQDLMEKINIKLVYRNGENYPDESSIKILDDRPLKTGWTLRMNAVEPGKLFSLPRMQKPSEISNEYYHDYSRAHHDEQEMIFHVAPMLDNLMLGLDMRCLLNNVFRFPRPYKSPWSRNNIVRKNVQFMNRTTPSLLEILYYMMVMKFPGTYRQNAWASDSDVMHCSSINTTSEHPSVIFRQDSCDDSGLCIRGEDILSNME